MEDLGRKYSRNNWNGRHTVRGLSHAMLRAIPAVVWQRSYDNYDVESKLFYNIFPEHALVRYV